MDHHHLDDLQRSTAAAVPRRVALGRLSAVVIGTLTALGLRDGSVETKRKKNKARSPGPQGPPGPPGPPRTFTRIQGQPFSVPEGGSRSGYVNCPAATTAIGGGMVSGNYACILAESTQRDPITWQVTVHCPTVAGAGTGFIPEVFCVS